MVPGLVWTASLSSRRRVGVDGLRREPSAWDPGEPPKVGSPPRSAHKRPRGACSATCPPARLLASRRSWLSHAPLAASFFRFVVSVLGWVVGLFAGFCVWGLPCSDRREQGTAGDGGGRLLGRRCDVGMSAICRVSGFLHRRVFPFDTPAQFRQVDTQFNKKTHLLQDSEL